MNFLRKRKKGIKRIATVLVCMVVVSIATAWYISYKWEPVLSSIVKDTILKSTGGLYRIEFESINLNILSGKIRLEQLQIIPDTAVYHRLKKTNTIPLYLFNIRLEKIVVNRYNPFDLYFNKTLDVYSINVHDPEIEVINYINRPKQAKDSIYKNPYDIIKNTLRSAHIDHINIINAKLTYISDYDSIRKSQLINFSGIQLKNLIIDSGSVSDSTRPFYSDDIRFSIGNFQIPMRDSLYILSFEEANATTGNSTVECYNLKIIPRYDEEHFQSVDGFRKARFDLNIKEVRLKGFDFKKLFSDHEIIAEKLLIRNILANVHTNKRIPYTPGKERRFLMESLEDIKIPFVFKITDIQKSRLNYSEYDEKIDHRWNIFFQNFTLKAYNLTNHPDYKQLNSLTKMNARANFNDIGDMSVDLKFYHGMNPGEFSCNGSFGAMDLTKLNHIVTPFSKVEIANCDVKKITFTMRGDKRAMRVNMSMPYEDLRIVVLQMDSNEQQLKRQGFISMLANLIVVKKDNPRNGNDLYSPSFIFSRKHEQSFFSFLWKGLFKGIKETIGLSTSMETEIQKRINALKETKSQREELRRMKEELKEVRVQKREERKSKRNR